MRDPERHCYRRKRQHRPGYNASIAMPCIECVEKTLDGLKLSQLFPGVSATTFPPTPLKQKAHPERHMKHRNHQHHPRQRYTLETPDVTRSAEGQGLPGSATPYDLNTLARSMSVMPEPFQALPEPVAKGQDIRLFGRSVTLPRSR